MTKAVTVLLAEDDVNLGYLLKENLESEGFDVTLSRDGEEALRDFYSGSFSLCIVDVMMPKKDGFALVKEIRKTDQMVPVIFLTAKNMEKDRIDGFMTGADDYVTKPFSMKELLLRVNAVLRRTAAINGRLKQEEKRCIGKFVFDYYERTLTAGAEKRTISLKEAELLKILFDNKGTFVSRTIIMNRVWGSDDYFVARSMDVYLTRLRKLLKADPNIEIQNLYGTGFKMVVNEC